MDFSSQELEALFRVELSKDPERSVGALLVPGSKDQTPKTEQRDLLQLTARLSFSTTGSIKAAL